MVRYYMISLQSYAFAYPTRSVDCLSFFITHQVLARTTLSCLDCAVGNVKLAETLNNIIDGSVKGGQPRLGRPMLS